MFVHQREWLRSIVDDLKASYYVKFTHIINTMRFRWRGFQMIWNFTHCTLYSENDDDTSYLDFKVNHFANLYPHNICDMLLVRHCCSKDILIILGQTPDNDNRKSPNVKKGLMFLTWIDKTYFIVIIKSWINPQVLQK